MHTSGRRSTLTDVARRAEVSVSTVSRVVNDRPVADQALVERVRKAARELDYRPNDVARDFRRGRTSTIAVVVPDLANPFFPHVLKGLALNAGEGDHRLLVVDSNEDPEEELRLVEQLSGRCDGIVLCSPRMPDASLRRVAALALPVICTNRSVKGTSLAAIGIDTVPAMEQAMEHLHALGHRRVGYLAGPTTSWSDRLRRKGLTSAASALAMDLTVVVAGSASDDGYSALPSLLEEGITALVAFNDLVAIGALSRLQQLGLSVPRDVSIVGCDDVPIAAFIGPPLTTVSLPKEELGKAAWATLQQLMQGQHVQNQQWLPSRLVVRESTAAARRP
jgi:LacI family transcriptional regulator